MLLYTEGINEFGALKESFLKESLEEEESILFGTHELNNGA